MKKEYTCNVCNKLTDNYVKLSRNDTKTGAMIPYYVCFEDCYDFLMDSKKKEKPAIKPLPKTFKFKY